MFLAERHIFIVFPSLRWTHRVFSWTSFYAPNQMASVLCSVRQTFEGTHKKFSAGVRNPFARPIRKTI